MSRIRLVVAVGFALAFAAGGSVGMLVGYDGRSGQKRRPGPSRYLAKELGLTPEQQAQMQKIWSEVMSRQGMQQSRQRRQALYRRRTEAVEALLTDEQRARYEQILADHAREMEKLDEEGHRLVQEAVERTKAVLTESQAAKYEEIRKSRHRGRHPGSRPPGPFWRGRRDKPSTRQAPEGSTNPAQP